jgi:hypothetical protein
MGFGLAGMMFGLSSHFPKILFRNIQKYNMKKIERTTKSYSITVPKELLPLLKRRAAQEGRSVSSYLCWLLRKDYELRPLENH